MKPVLGTNFRIRLWLSIVALALAIVLNFLPLPVQGQTLEKQAVNNALDTLPKKDSTLKRDSLAKDTAPRVVRIQTTSDTLTAKLYIDDFKHNVVMVFAGIEVVHYEYETDNKGGVAKLSKVLSRQYFVVVKRKKKYYLRSVDPKVLFTIKYENKDQP
jgi:hypothetical protein